MTVGELKKALDELPDNDSLEIDIRVKLSERKPETYSIDELEDYGFYHGTKKGFSYLSFVAWDDE